MSIAEQTDQLTDLWDELAGPSLKKFKFALASRGISLPAKAINTFVANQSDRQVARPGNRYTGYVVAFYENDRWATDIISFRKRPITIDGATYEHVVICQDMFTRFIRTAPLTKVMDIAPAIDGFFQEAKCRSIVSDNGGEYRSVRYLKMAARHGVQIEYRDAEDQNGPQSRVDNAIGVLKRKIQALLARGKGANWVEVLARATSAYNKEMHGAIGTSPDNIPDSIVLEQRLIAAEGAAHNDAEISERKALLDASKRFRTLKFKRGMKLRRAEESTWSAKIHTVKDFPIDSMVRDTEGKVFPTKRVLAIPLDSTDAIDTTTTKERLREYAEDMRALMPLQGKTPYTGIADAVAVTRPGLSTLLRTANIGWKEFIALFPELLTRTGLSISAANE